MGKNIRSFKLNSKSGHNGAVFYKGIFCFRRLDERPVDKHLWGRFSPGSACVFPGAPFKGGLKSVGEVGGQYLLSAVPWLL